MLLLFFHCFSLQRYSKKTKKQKIFLKKNLCYVFYYYLCIQDKSLLATFSRWGVQKMIQNVSGRNCINMHFFMGRPFAKKNRLFLKKSNVRFFQKQPVFFSEHFPCMKMHIYAVSA